MTRFERPQSSFVRHLYGALLSVSTVAVVTGAVFALKPVAPVLSLGVLYVVAVVAVAVVLGLAYAVSVAIATCIGEVLHVPRVKVELESLRRAEPEEQALELTTSDRSVGRLFVRRGTAIDDRIRERVLPGIASLLAVAVDRERLGRTALE